MRFAISLLLSVVLISPAVWAQEASVPQAPVAPASPAPAAALPVPVISLEAKVVQIILNDEHRQGVDWEAIVSDFHTLQLKKEGTVSWSDKKYTLSVGEVSNEDYEVLLDALDTVGRVSQTDFSSFSLNKDESKTQDFSSELKDIPPVQLELIWSSSPSGEPKIKVTPSVGMVSKTGRTSTTIDTYTDETELVLSGQKTIVIGGLMKEDEITKMRKFPLLGDLPVLGLVFRKQGRLMQKSETIIFLTVHMNEEPIKTED